MTLAGGTDFFREELARMGPWSNAEKKAALLLCAAILLWTTDFIHHVPPAMIALGAGLAALLPPVGILGAYEYYKHGHLNLTYALLLGAGLLIGGYFGAIYAVKLPALTLRRIFGIFLLLTSLRMLYK